MSLSPIHDPSGGELSECGRGEVRPQLLSEHARSDVEAKLRGRRGRTIDQGMSGAAPGSQPEYLIHAQLIFESVEAFKAALESEGADYGGHPELHRYSTSDPIKQGAGAEGFVNRVSDFGGWRVKAVIDDHDPSLAPLYRGAWLTAAAHNHSKSKRFSSSRTIPATAVGTPAGRTSGGYRWLGLI